MNLFFGTEYENIIIFIVICILIVLSGINTVFLIKNSNKIKSYKALYDEALAKFNSKDNIKDEFTSIYNRIAEAESSCENIINTCKKLENHIKKHIQKIGLVKYNAYDETDNKLSFALSLLDNNDDGIIINHIYSKHGSNTYAKMVEKGEVIERISEEEAGSLKIAIEDKKYLERKTVAINSNKTSKRKDRK